MKKNNLKKPAADGHGKTETDARSATPSSARQVDPSERTLKSQGGSDWSLTQWCQSKGQMFKDKVKGKTRFHRIRTNPVKCECKNYYCQCGPNPALEAMEDEKDRADKVKMKRNKATNASVLREAAILLKEDQKKQEKILQLLSASRNYLDYEKYLEELRETQEKEALVELEKKHLSGQLSYEEAILAKQRVVEDNAKRREEYLEEKAALEEELLEFREKEMAKVKEMVREVQEQHDKAKEMQVKAVKDKRKEAQAMAQNLKAMLQQKMKEREQEIERKIAAIREFKILQQIKKEELNSREEKMTKLVSVSMEELKTRLALYKRKMREELMTKRSKIQKQKCRQEMIKTAASRFVQQVKNCREEMKIVEGSKPRSTSWEARVEDAQLSELRAKLEEMAEAVHNWLSKTMGYFLDVRSPVLGELLYDGTVFHDILCKHNVINPKKCLPPPSNPTTEVAAQSLADLGIWFKLLGISHSKDLLASAAKKDSRACLRILFELFAKLQTQEMTHFLMKQRALMLQQEGGRQFAVSKSAQPSKPLPPQPRYFKLENLLREKDFIVEGYKNMKKTLEDWTKSEMQRRRDVVKKWSQRETYLSTEFELYLPPVPPDPMETFDKSLSLRPKDWPLTNWTNEKYVAYLRQKRMKTATNMVLKMKMQDTLMNDLWSEILEERDKELTEHFKQILLQPCQHETRMVNTLKKTHENYKNFAQFSSFVNDLAEEDYTQAEKSFEVDKERNKQLEKEKEMQRVLELHQRLWDEKLRVKRENHVNWCGQTAVDLVDFVVRVAEHRAEFHVDPPQKVLDEWKELFFKELPITREPRNFIRDLFEDNEAVRPEILKSTMEDMLEEEGDNDFAGYSPYLDAPVQDTPRAIEPTIDSRPNYSAQEANWNVIMDFEKTSFQAHSIPRLPDVSVLKSSQALVDVAEKKKCKDDMECLLDLDVVDCLNNYNLRTYLSLIGPWDLKQWPEIWPVLPYDEKLNVLGYVVHRLLDLKYPMPKGPKPPRLPKFEIKAILGKFTDRKAAFVLESLKDLLNKEGVEVIDVSMPVNYCLNAYRDEMEITELGMVLKNKKSLKDSGIEDKSFTWSFPYRRWERRLPKFPEKPPRKDDDEVIPLPAIAAAAAGPKKSAGSRKSMARKSKVGGRKSMARKSQAGGRKSKAGGSRKSMARKSQAGGRKSQAGGRKSQAGGRKSMARKSNAGGPRKSMGGRKSITGKRQSTGSVRGRPKTPTSPTLYGLLYNKATQIPSIPDLSKRYKHSPAGKLGKLAFETLAEGKKLNDVLLGKMLIEYLKTLYGKKGFVLVNFPLSALQANIFENLFTGLPMQYPMIRDSEVDLFRTKDFPDAFSHIKSFLDFDRMVFDYVKEQEPPVELLEIPEAATGEEKEKKHSAGGRKSLAKRKSAVGRKSSAGRKSAVGRKSAAGRKSATGRKSAAGRKSSAGRKSAAPRKSKTPRKSAVGRKSVAGGKKESKAEPKKSKEAPPEPPKPPPPPPPPKEPPKPPPTLEELKRLRISEILPRPNKDLDDLLYGTSSYFSSYINPLQMQAHRKELMELARVKNGPFDHDPAKLLIKEHTKTHPFYKSLDLVKDFDYMRFDNETIKRLARVILGAIWDPDDVERKPSIEIFGVAKLERVEKGPPPSTSSGSSQASRTSFYDRKQGKTQKLDDDVEVKYRKYSPIKPPPPPPPPPPPEPVAQPEPETDDTKHGKSTPTGSRKSMARKSVSRKSMSRKSMKRQSTARKSQTARKSKTARKSTARKSKTPGKRQSMKRKSKVSGQRESMGGGGQKKSGTPRTDKEKSLSIVLPPKPKPGEPDWVYIKEPIPYEIGYTAATLWECAENAYVEDMEKIFYLLRMHDMKVLPYKEYVRSSLREAMTEDTEKRHLVTNFQLMLNKVDDDFRHDLDMKHELFVRVDELNEILSRIALERRERSLVKKAELIAQGWLANQAYTLANLYLSMMQVEMNMCADALQVLHDYYMGILGEIPKEDRQAKVAVVKNRMAVEEDTGAAKMSLTGGRRRRRTVSKTSLPQLTLRRSLVIPLKIQDFLMKTDRAPSSGDSSKPPEPNPTYPLIEQSGSLKSKIGGLKDYYEGIIKDPGVGKGARGKILAPVLTGAPAGAGPLAIAGKPPPSDKGPPARKSMAKRQSTAKRKSTAKRQSTARKSKAGGQRKSQAGKRASQAGKRASKAGKRASQAGKRASQAGKRASQAGKRPSQAGKSPKKGSKTSREPEQDGPDMVDVAKEEWAAAVENQAARSEFRVRLIEARAKKDLDILLDSMRDLFLEYQSIVDDQLMKEVAAIHDCMYLFKRAIEEGLPIQPLVVLDDNKFYVDRKVLLYADPPPPPPTPLVETTNPYSFTVEQLNTMVTKFSQMAPMGVIETPMIQALSGMAIAGHESGKPTIPSGWAQLDSFDYKGIFVEAFGDQTCLDWRNFTINIAEIPYPTIGDLLYLKMEYGLHDPNHELLISWKDFSEIPLWFENEFGETIEDDLKLSLAKGLIFKMFKISDDEMNYYDMLMGYCRAEDPEDGLGMALDLLMDTGYILQPDKCIREDESEKIHPRKIIDFILVNFFKDLLDLTETVQLKYLPRLTNQEVFASEDNEFELSEDILRQNKGKRVDYGDLSSTDSETNRPKPERVLYLDDDDELPAKYNCEKWQMCVPYEIALALVTYALNFYALSPIHHHRILNIEGRLKDLYREKGTGSHIKAYRLTTSDLFKELYAKTSIFRKTNITQLVQELVEKKQVKTGPAAQT